MTQAIAPGRFSLLFEPLEARALPAGTVLTRIDVVQTNAWWGDLLDVRYTARNDGSTAADPTAVPVAVSDARSGGTSLPLGEIDLPALAAGAATSGMVELLLPATAGVPPDFLRPAAFFVGADVAGATGDSLAPSDNVVVRPVLTEAPGNDATATAQPIDSVPFRLAGTLDGPGDRDVYRINVKSGGLLSASIAAAGAAFPPTSLTLYGANGEVVVRSDGAGPDRRNPSFDQGVYAGVYYLAVDAAGSFPGPAGYQLQASFIETGGPYRPSTIGISPRGIALADLDADGSPDEVAADYYSGGVLVLWEDGSGVPPASTRVATGDGPVAVATGDWNGDGRADVVVANQRSRSITILFGAGGRAFAPAVTLPVGDAPTGLAVADFNGDGVDDIAVADDGLLGRPGGVWVLLGTGGGAFAAPVHFDTGYATEGVTAADVNGDSATDLVAANAGLPAEGGALAVLLGDAAGSFAAATVYAVGAATKAVVVRDVTGDGIPDLVAADPGIDSRGGAVWVLAGAGDGTFGAPRAVSAGFAPVDVAVDDVTGDGIPDLAVADNGDVTHARGLQVAVGVGDGTFRAPAYTAAGAARAVATADIDGDGTPDVVVANSGFVGDAGSVYTFLEAGNGSVKRTANYLQKDRAESGTVADVNGDGILDIVTANSTSKGVAVLLGVGDGSFRLPRRFPVGVNPGFIAAADLNADGTVDLAVTDRDGTGRASAVWVLDGAGDGTFGTATRYAVPGVPAEVRIADMNGDSIPDLIVAVDRTGPNFPGYVGVLFGNPDGTFQRVEAFAAGYAPKSVAVADLNGDGNLDLVVADTGDKNSPSYLWVLDGDGRGHFTPARGFAAGRSLLSVTVADLNGDGKLDLTAADGSDDANFVGNVVVLDGDGKGGFAAPRGVPTGQKPFDVAVADVNGDHVPDLIVADVDSQDVAVVLGAGGGRFAPARLSGASRSPRQVLTGDFDGDHKQDVAVVSAGFDNGSGSVLVLAGNGDGSFRGGTRFAAGRTPYSAVAADFNADGRADLIVPNYDSQNVSVFLADGSTSLGPAISVFVGGSPVAVAAGDVNGDGRADAVVVDEGSGDHPSGIQVLLGNGDGTFRTGQRLDIGTTLSGIALAFLDGDQVLDIALSDLGPPGADGAVWVLHGIGDGRFSPVRSYPSGYAPRGVAAADLNGDGVIDLAVADNGPADVPGGVWVLRGLGRGVFDRAIRFDAGYAPTGLIAADLNGDRRPELIVQDFGLEGQSGVLQVLRNDGTGGFDRPTPYAAGYLPVAVAPGDLNGDQLPDLVVADQGRDAQAGGVYVLNGKSGGGFAAARYFAAGDTPYGVAVGDVNADGRPDVLAANYSSNDVSLLIGTGQGGLTLTTADRSVDSRSAPLRGDFDRDGTPDVAVLTRAGEVLVRRGRPGTANLFDAPVVVNPGRPARDLAAVRTAAGLALAVTDTTGDDVTVYQNAAPGGYYAADHFRVGRLPQRLVAGDLNGDGRDDLAVDNTVDNTVSIAFQLPGGGFGRPAVVPGGLTPSDLALVDLDGRDGPDVVVTNRRSGDVTVAYNDAGHAFTRVVGFHAGTGPYDATFVDNRLHPLAREEPVALAAGRFTADGRPGVLVVDRGTHQLRLLAGSAAGGLEDPTAARSTSTGLPGVVNDRPGQVICRDFDRDGGLDAAVVLEDRNEVWIFHGAGDGTFQFRAAVPAGNAPTGVTAADVNGDGVLDLLVGNGFGDVLFVLGNGDGTFRPFVRADQTLPFAVLDLNGDGIANDVVLADQARDSAAGFVRAGGATFTPGAFASDGRAGLIGPGAVAVADVDGVNGPDLIFANTGSNNVLLYLRQPNGGFADRPVSFFAGTGPVALRVDDLNADGLPDLAVANQGSNDVSVLLGSRGADANGDGVVDARDLFRLGPRLSTGGAGVNAVTTRDVTGDGIPDVIATNGQSGTVSTIPGIGKAGAGTGSFADNAVRTVAISTGPVHDTVVPRTGPGMTVDAAGGLIMFDPATGAGGEVFRPLGSGISSFQQVGAGADLRVVTANEDGSVSVLGPSAGGLSELVTVGTGLSTGGAVAVVGADVYVSGLAGGRAEVLALQSLLSAGAESPAVGQPLPGGGPALPIPIAPAGVVTDLTTPAGVVTDLTTVGNAFGLVAVFLTSLGAGGGGSVVAGPAGGAVEVVNPLGVGLGTDFAVGEEALAFVDRGLGGFADPGPQADDPGTPPGTRPRGLIPFFTGAADELDRATRPDDAPPPPPHLPPSVWQGADPPSPRLPTDAPELPTTPDVTRTVGPVAGVVAIRCGDPEPPATATASEPPAENATELTLLAVNTEGPSPVLDSGMVEPNGEDGDIWLTAIRVAAVVTTSWWGAPAALRGRAAPLGRWAAIDTRPRVRLSVWN